MTPDEFADLGFTFVQERRDGTVQYARREHPYLAYWLLARPDGTAELSWEFALGEYLGAKGMSVSAQDEMSLLMFPAGERRGPLEASWVSQAVEQVQQRLATIDFANGT